jgi:glycosyltransferase involved in cell wall biosynthesis
MGRKRKVAVIIEDLNVGGLERVAEEIIMGLRGSVDFTVICLKDGGLIYRRMRTAGIACEVIPVRGLYDLVGMLVLTARLQRGGFDAVHTHGITGNALGAAAAYGAAVPRVIAHVHTLTMHAGWFSRMKERVLNGSGRTIVFCSKAAQTAYRRFHRVADARCTVIYNGIACERFTVCDRIPRQPVVFGCVASLFSHKGHAVLIEAVRQLRAQGIVVSVLCAGSGPLEMALRAQAAEAKVDDIVIFGGQVDDIVMFFKGIDVLVLPSTEREGMPMSILEAMAAGKPVIASDVGGVSEAVLGGKTGVLVPPRDPKALAGAMKRAVLDIMSFAAMGDRGRRFARAEFSRQTMLDRIERLYG